MKGRLHVQEHFAALRARIPTEVVVLIVAGLAALPFVLKIGGFGVWPIAAAVVPPLVVTLVWWRVGQGARETLRELFAVPLAVGYAVAPLLLAVLVILFYAARALEPALQAIVGFVLGTVVVLLLATEHRRGALGQPKQLVGRVAIAALVGVALVVWIGLVFEGFRQAGGVGALLEATAILLWAVAAALRLAGLLTRRARPLLVVPPFVVAGVLLASFGYLPGVEIRGLDEATWLELLFAWLGLYALVEGVWNLLHPDEPHDDDAVGGSWIRAARTWGRDVALTSALVLAVAFFWVGYEARVPPDLGDPESRLEPGTLDELPTAMSDARLASAFLPVLQFVTEEAWRPTRAEDYVERLELHDLYGRVEQSNPSPDTLPRDCVDVTQDACYVLVCPEEAPTCTEVDTSHAVGTVYAHVVRYGRERDRRFFAGRIRHPFFDRRGDRRHVTVLIQYWFFYVHNRWRAATPLGFLIQEHPADWESVTIGLSGREPLFVAYSAHCGGRWYAWQDVEVAAGDYDGTRWTRTRKLPGESRALHPVVAVAHGSHANYLHSWYGRPPDWASCERVPEDATWALTYAGNVRDVTDDDVVVFPPDVHLVGTTSPIMSFRGFWGVSDRTSLEAFGKPNRIGRSGWGPTSPGLKDVWNRPIQSIRAGPAWKRGQT